MQERHLIKTGNCNGLDTGHLRTHTYTRKMIKVTIRAVRQKKKKKEQPFHYVKVDDQRSGTSHGDRQG